MKQQLVPYSWSNKLAVITGGASGIGAATVAEFASRGAEVVILDRAAPGASKPEKAVFIPCDVSSSREVQQAAERVSREFGKVSFLVNCAGIQRYGTGVTTSEETWDEVMAVNLKSMFLTFRAFFSSMKDSGTSVV